MKAPELNWIDRPEEVWQVLESNDGRLIELHSTKSGAEVAIAKRKLDAYAEAATLHRPSLQPIYGGPTLLEALWNEMDALMERLMTGQTQEDTCGRKGFHGAPEQTYEGNGFGFDNPCEHEDSGDKYRAQELAWVLAIVTNAYDSSVDRIRAEAMQRWNAAQDVRVQGLITDLHDKVSKAMQDDAVTRPEGADQ